ncbi:MAG: rhodanese-like domain-containing protein [Crocinitomicaceae bacterium]|nr:rhodanese-like domain-containing protein [Crocinitomicaceae bacterium]
MVKVLNKEGIIILDVRTPGETSRGMIPGAVEIDFRGANFEKEVEKLDKSKPVYIYCASGGRSKSAQEKMSSLGFKETYNLLGGFNNWSAQGLPTK